jgi:pyridoxal phosphate enzyme (YggS family)
MTASGTVDLAQRIEAVRKRIEAAARDAGRDPETIRIIAVSKTFPAERVLDAVACGLRVFGENRVQEAVAKIPSVAEASPSALQWHLVGGLQRNKAARAVQLFQVIESVDRPELADALARAARAQGTRLRVLLQVNVDREPQKGGVLPEALGTLMEHVDGLPELEPLGLMTIPRFSEDPEAARPTFASLRESLLEVNKDRAPERRLRVLSMGMSHDFDVAIREGADWVRIGTAIFGERSRR